MKTISFVNLLACLVGFAALATATSGGPGGACKADIPTFQDVASRGQMGPQSDGTYRIAANEVYTPGTPMKIRIIGGGQYKGFILKANSGSFPDNKKAVACANVDTAASHTDAEPKTGATEHTWTPPAAGTGPVKFRAIVVSTVPKTYLTAEVTIQEATNGGGNEGGNGGNITDDKPIDNDPNTTPVVGDLGDSVSAYTQCGWSFGEPVMDGAAPAKVRGTAACAKACDDNDECLFITYNKNLPVTETTCYLQKSIATNEDWWSCGKVGSKQESLGFGSSGSVAGPSFAIMAILAVCALFR